jgi:hypothetical protein
MDGWDNKRLFYNEFADKYYDLFKENVNRVSKINLILTDEITKLTHDQTVNSDRIFTKFAKHPDINLEGLKGATKLVCAGKVILVMAGTIMAVTIYKYWN